jgi:predicted dienelactone hydrolase
VKIKIGILAMLLILTLIFTVGCIGIRKMLLSSKSSSEISNNTSTSNATFANSNPSKSSSEISNNTSTSNATFANSNPSKSSSEISNNTSISYSDNGPYTVRVLEFPNLSDNKRQNRKVPIKVHMPSSNGIYPVVIISHGAGGNWDTHYAQAEHLASNGYIVLCLEHIGSNTERMQQGVKSKLDITTINKNLHAMIYDSNEVLNRPRDVSFAIDILNEWNNSNNTIRKHVDMNNIGVMGHSFGAYTTMVVCGMRPALDWIIPTVAPGQGIGPDLSDKRVKCGIALSPQGADEPFFLRESFNYLKTPLMGISGTNDQQQNGLPPQNRYDAFAYWPQNGGQNKFVWLANAAHLDFTSTQETSVPSPNRDSVQKVVRAASLLYFNYYLKGDTNALNMITTNGLEKYLSGKVSSVEVRNK